MMFLRKQILIFSILMCLMIILQLSTPSFTENSEKNTKKNFEIDFYYGFNKFYVANSDTLAKVKITNNFKNIDGKVQILFDSNQSGAKNEKFYKTYSQDLYLSKHSTKTIDFYLPVGEKDSLVLKVIDKSGKVIWSEILKLGKPQEPSNFMIKSIQPKNNLDIHTEHINIGVLSDNFANLSYINLIPLSTRPELERIAKNNSTTLISNLDGMVPEDKYLLKTLSIIIINDYNTKNLTDSQLNALKGWVEDGGTLLVGTGENFQKTLNGLKDLNYLNIENTSEINSFKANDDLTFSSSNSIILASCVLNNGQESLKDDKNTIVYNKKLKKGNITILAFDMASFSSWKGNDQFILELIKQYVNLDIVRYNYIDDTQNTLKKVDDVAGYISSEVSSDLRVIRFIFIIILFLVRPIVELILKKINRVSLMWIYIPITSLIFILFMHTYSSENSSSNTLINSISTTQLFKNSEYGKSKSTVAVMVPKKKSIKVVTDKIHYNYIDSEIKSAKDKVPSAKDIIIPNALGIAKESKVEFEYGKSRDCIILQSEEEVSLDIKAYNIEIDKEKITGKIYNNSDINLEDVSLLYGNLYYKIGDIRKQSIKDININLIDLKRFTSENDLINRMYSVNLESSQYTSVPQQYDIVPTYRSNDISNDYIKSFVLKNALNDYYSSNNFSFSLIAWSKDKLIKGLEVNNNEVNRIDRNLLLIPFVDYMSDKKIDLPFGVIKPEPLKIEGVKPTGISNIFSGDGYIVYSFKPNMAFNIIDILRKNTKENGYVYDDVYIGNISIGLQSNVTKGKVKAHIYNYAKDNWEILNKDLIEIDKNNKDIYCGKDQEIKIKLQTISSKSFIQEPTFSVKGILR